jgi:hypothetical protein
VSRGFHLGANAQRTARFIVALALIIYEATIYHGEARWHLILVYGTMMGLPLAELGDEVRRRTQPREGVDDARAPMD